MVLSSSALRANMKSSFTISAYKTAGMDASMNIMEQFVRYLPQTNSGQPSLFVNVRSTYCGRGKKFLFCFKNMVQISVIKHYMHLIREPVELELWLENVRYCLTSN
jgi:hypothetical protein